MSTWEKRPASADLLDTPIQSSYVLARLAKHMETFRPPGRQASSVPPSRSWHDFISSIRGVVTSGHSHLRGHTDDTLAAHGGAMACSVWPEERSGRGGLSCSM